jgi:cell division protease FtsH
MFLSGVFLVSLLFSGTNGFFRGFQKRIALTSLYDGLKENPEPESNPQLEELIKKLNSDNREDRDNAILGNNTPRSYKLNSNNKPNIREKKGGFQIFIGRNGIQGFQFGEGDEEEDMDEEDKFDIASRMGVPVRKQPHDRDMRRSVARSERTKQPSSRDKKSENFEVLYDFNNNFTNIGGYDTIKTELEQCIDLLKNTTKYEKFNVRVPKGIIFEGPPGNGKTMIAKAFAGEAGTGFIAVSGAEFQEKYVGVGASRIRELFSLAKKNVPCVIFIDEIDAVGRKRSGDGESSSSERDSTLNELLVSLDGFKNISGIFIIGATNRADLLDSALMRPGRIDKRIFIGMPDSKTREAIVNIHIRGKPHDETIHVKDLIEQTNGFSGAQIENLLNEAMLNALRNNREVFTKDDTEVILNRMMVGWQPTEHQFTSELIDQIAVHEMGHVVVGMHSSHHANISKVTINLSSPNSPAYTVFEASTTTIATRETLFEHLMILLAGRIAEETIYGVSVTTGAINDFEEALKLAERMVVYYGMGKKVIYPSMSDKYKERIDQEVSTIISDAYRYAERIVHNSKDFILEGADLLKREKTVQAETLYEIMNTKYKKIMDL